MTNTQPFSARPLESLHADRAVSLPGAALLGDRISRALQGVQHGQVTIVVHDGQVVQIDRLVRVRQFRSKRSQNH